MKKEQRIIMTGYIQRKRRWMTVTICLALLTLFLSIAMLLLGNTWYSLSTVIDVLLGESVKGASFAIMTIRLPRMLGGLLVGIALAVAGNTFQTMLRNPLASPDIIGITAGSSVAAVFCILVLKLSGSMVSIIAVISGLLVATIIYLLSSGKGFSGARLILIGIGIQTMLNALISYLLLKASRYDVPAALRWLSGSLNGIQLENIWGLLVIVIIFVTMTLILTNHLKVLELGDEFSTTLGIKTNQTRLLLIISSVFLIAFASSISGPIAFVAFLSGPIASRLVGRGATNILASGFVGASLVLLADLIGQFAFDTRFPVGVITGILGSPYLIFLLIKMNKNGGSS